MGNCGMSQQDKIKQAHIKGDDNKLTKLLNDIDIELKNNKDNKTLLMHVLEHNYNYGNDIVKEIIKRKANIHAIDTNGNSVLFYAIKSYNMEMCLYILNNGANIEEKNISGETPLMMASKNGFFNMVVRLIHMKANINCVDDIKYMGALHFALYSYGNGMSILEYQYKEHQYKEYYKEHNSLKVIDILLENGADVNQKMINGNTPLHCLIPRDIIVKLLKNGADKTIKNNDGLTPFDNALKYNWYNIYTLELLRPNKPEPKPVYKNNIILKYKLEPVYEDNMPPKYETLFPYGSIFYG